MTCAPHHLASQGASPRGEAAKRLTIFASLCASTMRQGEGLTKARITLFAEKIKFTEFFSGKGKPWKEENF